MQEQGFSTGRSAVQHVVTSPDGTTKYLLRLADGRTVETVRQLCRAAQLRALFPAELTSCCLQVAIPDKKDQRLTVCVSSQVCVCNVCCRLCCQSADCALTPGLSGRLRHGLRFLRHRQGRLRTPAVSPRDPRPGHGGQRGLQTESDPCWCAAVLCCWHWQPRALTAYASAVFMGMGEPLLNLKQVLKAHALINEQLGIGARRWVHMHCTACAAASSSANRHPKPGRSG